MPRSSFKKSVIRMTSGAQISNNRAHTTQINEYSVANLSQSSMDKHR